MSKNGFTLIELIVVITIVGILAITGGLFLMGPLNSYKVAAENAALVGLLDNAFTRLSRDTHNAVPNSIRVKPNGLAVEMLNILEGHRYRTKLTTLGVGAPLDVTVAQTGFNILGTFANPQTSSSIRIVVYNLGTFGADSDAPDAGVNVYNSASNSGTFPPAGTHVITPSGTSITLANVSGEGVVTLGTAHQFALDSPNRRMYVTDTPISYVCDLTAGTLTRYENYATTSTQPTSGASLPLSGGDAAIVVDNVSACDFDYNAGTATRRAVLTVTLTITDSAGGTATLVKQIHGGNAA